MNTSWKWAHLASKRSTCIRHTVDCVIMKEKRILATGYNGTPKDLKHCEVVGCVRTKLKVPHGYKTDTKTKTNRRET